MRLLSSANAQPFIAQLSLSVPPEVKKISLGLALIHFAISSLAFLIAAFSQFLIEKRNMLNSRII